MVRLLVAVFVVTMTMAQVAHCSPYQVSPMAWRTDNEIPMVYAPPTSSTLSVDWVLAILKQKDVFSRRDASPFVARQPAVYIQATSNHCMSRHAVPPASRSLRGRVWDLSAHGH